MPEIILPALREALTRAGWTAPRRVAIDQWVQPLMAEGYAFSPGALEILENLSGLVVPAQKRPSAVSDALTTVFDPVGAAAGHFARIGEWQNRLGLLLSPIAAADQVTIVLLATDGRLMGAWDRFLFLLGDSFEQGLERLVFANRKSILLGDLRVP